jgi:hypothetical protein
MNYEEDGMNLGQSEGKKQMMQSLWTWVRI